jgi:hypothetical protein
MTATTEKQTDNRLAKAWYVLYPLDAHAIGPYGYRQFVSAERAVEDAKATFGEYPCEVWPDGPTEETEEYDYPVAISDDEE